MRPEFLPEFLTAVRSQTTTGQPYCLATVIRVIGSASARTGSRAIFDLKGRNIHGWIGGGCAERFVGEQSIEAIADKQTRIVLADLDDEIFGLGIACGGQMEVFIEPVYPREPIELNVSETFKSQAEHFARTLGLEPEMKTGSAESLREVILELARSIAHARGRELHHLRDRKSLPVTFATEALSPITQFKIVGKGRIVENLATWGMRLGWQTSVAAPGLRSEDFPKRVACECLLESYGELEFQKGSAVVIASHHASDPEFVGQAIRSGAAYVGMIGSRKRALETLTKNQIAEGGVAPSALFVPAGFDLDCRSPEEIALSIIAEIVWQERRPERQQVIRRDHSVGMS